MDHLAWLEIVYVNAWEATLRDYWATYDDREQQMTKEEYARGTETCAMMLEQIERLRQWFEAHPRLETPTAYAIRAKNGATIYTDTEQEKQGLIVIYTNLHLAYVKMRDALTAIKRRLDSADVGGQNPPLPPPPTPKEASVSALDTDPLIEYLEGIQAKAVRAGTAGVIYMDSNRRYDTVVPYCVLAADPRVGTVCLVLLRILMHEIMQGDWRLAESNPEAYVDECMKRAETRTASFADTTLCCFRSQEKGKDADDEMFLTAYNLVELDVWTLPRLRDALIRMPPKNEWGQ